MKVTTALLKLAHSIHHKIQTLIPFETYRHWRDDKIFVLWQMRASKDAYGTRKLLRRWNIDLSRATAPEKFLTRKVSVTPPNFIANANTATINHWMYYLNQLPKRAHKEEHKNGEPVLPFEALEAIAKNAVIYGVGNCGEKSAVAFCFLLELTKRELKALDLLNKPILFERVGILGKGDHAFLILNRKHDSNLNDMLTWGDTAIVLDASFDEVYVVAKEFLKGNSESVSFNHICQYQHKFTTIFGHEGTLGISTHSQRWIEHRRRKHEPINLTKWKPHQFHPNAENIPYLSDEDLGDGMLAKGPPQVRYRRARI